MTELGVDYRKAGRCPDCGGWIAWASVEDHPFVQMPVDRWSSPTGNIRVRVEHGRLWARVLENAELEHARQTEQLHRSHYATCSHADTPRS